MCSEQRPTRSVSVGNRSEKVGGPEVKLSPVLQSLLSGLKAGGGITSLLSPSTLAGVRPDLVPIVVSLSHGDGLRLFLTSLATMYALRQEGSGERTLTLSFNLGREALQVLLDSYNNAGGSGEIPFEISLAVGQESTT